MIFLRLVTFTLLQFVVFPSISQSEDQRIVSSYYEFEAGSTEYLHGDNVVFRSAPTPSSDAIDTLKIGTELQIIQKTEETAKMNGLEWNWYQVRVEGKKGYILGGLIALDRVDFGDAIYLFTVARIKQSSDDWEYFDYKVRTRVLDPSGEYYGHESKLNTNSFYAEATGNRGIEGIEHIVVIKLNAAACGVDEGEIYLFDDGTRLIEALQLSSVSDVGAFWFSESVIFPKDEDGWEGVVRYKREYGEPRDEEYDWTTSTIHTLNLRWEGDHFSPNIEEFEFDEDEDEDE